jgi:hypothetical protein
MGTLIDIINSLKEINKTFNDGDNLSKFFGLMKSYNLGEPLKDEVRHQIEDFFEYKWTYDRNQAIHTDDDFALLE